MSLAGALCAGEGQRGTRSDERSRKSKYERDARAFKSGRIELINKTGKLTPCSLVEEE